MSELLAAAHVVHSTSALDLRFFCSGGLGHWAMLVAGSRWQAVIVPMSIWHTRLSCILIRFLVQLW